MSQQKFSEEQRKEIKDIIYNVIFGSSKERGYFVLDMERNLHQKIDNVEATQKIVIDNQIGIKSLVEMDYEAIIKNRETMNNRFDNLEKRIDQGFNNINGRFNSLESKLS